MANSGKPTPELCFLSGRLRWTLLPKEHYGDSLSGRGSTTQPYDLACLHGAFHCGLIVTFSRLWLLFSESHLRVWFSAWLSK